MNQKIKLVSGSLLFSILANLYLFLCSKVALSIIILRTEAELLKSVRWWATWIEVSGNVSSRIASICLSWFALAGVKQQILSPTRDKGLMWISTVWFLYRDKGWYIMPRIWGFFPLKNFGFWKLSGFHKLVCLWWRLSTLREPQAPLWLGKLNEKSCKLWRWGQGSVLGCLSAVDALELLGRWDTRSRCWAGH